MFLKISQCSQENTSVGSLFNKVAGFQPCNFIKKRFQHRCFLVNTEKFLRTTFRKNICERLLLKVVFMWKREFSFLSYQTSNRVKEKYLSQFLQSCFPLAEVTNNFLVSWNYGSHNSICSFKESFISRGSFDGKPISFSIWVFYHEHSRFTGQQGKGEAISLTPLYHFHLLQRHLQHLGISRVITAES